MGAAEFISDLFLAAQALNATSTLADLLEKIKRKCRQYRFILFLFFFFFFYWHLQPTCGF
jgi:hypothetical protein